MSKMAKFFAVCGAVCVLGIILTVAGVATGGVQGLEKFEGSHSWFNVGPMDSETDLLEVGDYDSIKVDGNMDVALIGPDFVDVLDAEFAGEWLTEDYNEELAGNVIVNWKEGTGEPDIQVVEGVLTIKANEAGPDMEVNLSADDSSPDIIVFCKGKEIKNVDISLGYGDVAIGGIECENMNVNSKSGDIELAEVNCGKMMLKMNAGDIEFTNCKGDMEAEVNSGDIEFDTALKMDEFNVTLHTASGDIQINDSDEEFKDFTHEGGPNKITFRTNAGDIEADFMRVD